MSEVDGSILSLIPHRSPMLLINKLRHVDDKRAEAEAIIDNGHLFFQHHNGVPAWVGIEIMGQTAALIAGKQQQTGKLSDHIGFLLAARNYQCNVSYFKLNSRLLINCEEVALVGETLANFRCTIRVIEGDDQPAELASGMLSVYRTANTMDSIS